MGIIRDSFVVFKNWGEAIKQLPDEYRLETYEALFEYGITGEMPNNLSPVVKAMMTSFSVGMENSICRYNASVENGKLGGAPKGNQNARKQPKTTEVNLTENETTENNLEQPKTNKNNLNVNVNDNVNYKVSKKVSNKKNILNNSACACESYDDIFKKSIESGMLTEGVKNSLIDFIKHLLVNDVKLINSRLESIIVGLEMRYGDDDAGKIACINRAINGGYSKLDFEGE